MAYVGQNADFIKAYNEYLDTNSITQAMATGYVTLGDKVFPVNYDMFYDFLLNKIVLQTITSHEFADKLDFLYRGDLAIGGEVEDERTILDGKANDYGATDFEEDVTNPFTKKKTRLSVVYHKVNARKKIKITYSEKQVKEAFLNEGGISNLVNNIINDVQVQYSGWAYLQKRKAICDVDYAQRISFADNADFCKKVKDIIVDFQYFDNSYKYNATCLYTPMNIKDAIIIMSEKFKNMLDIDYFTGLFNVSYAELKEQIHYIDEFADPKVKCIICDRRGLYFYKTLNTAQMLVNPADLTKNYWLHFWRIHSVSPHYNCVALVEGETGVADGTNEIIDGASVVVKFANKIKYTLDGSEPTATNGIVLNANTALTIQKPTDNGGALVATVKFVSLDAEGAIIDGSLRVSHYRFV